MLGPADGDGSHAWLVDSDEEEGHEIPWMTAVSGVFFEGLWGIMKGRPAKGSVSGSDSKE